jgi:hypothetical protein
MSSIDDLAPAGVRTPAAIDAWFDEHGHDVWTLLRSQVEARCGELEDDVLETMCAHAEGHPSACLAILMLLAARDARRRAELLERCFALLERFPAEGLAMASHHLPQAPVLIDARWIARAQRWAARHPAAAWGVLACAALHRPDLMDGPIAPEMERHRSADERSWAIVSLGRASARASVRDALVGEVADALASGDAAAKVALLDGVEAVALDRPELRTARLLAAVVGALDRQHASGWGLLAAWARDEPAAFGPAVLDRIARASCGQVRRELEVLGALLTGPGVGVDRSAIVARYRDAVRRDPAAALDAAQHCFQLGALAHVDAELVDAVSSNLAANPAAGCALLRRFCEHQPALLTADAVSAVIAVAAQAANVAFGFCLSAIQRRPDLSRLLTYGLFECLHREPAHRAHARETEIRAITILFKGGERREFMRKLLADPPAVGNRRSRMLMELMFGHPVLERRRLLRGALVVAATATIDIRCESGLGHRRATPAWDALLLGCDCAIGGAISAESQALLLEGVHHLRRAQAPQAATAWLKDLDLGGVGPLGFGGELAFLDQDAELTLLHGRIQAWARRFGIATRLPTLKDLRDGCADARREADEIIRRLPEAKGEQRERLASRLEAVRRRLGPLADIDPGGDAPIDAAAWEREQMRLRVQGVLRRDAMRIPLDAVNRAVRAMQA